MRLLPLTLDDVAENLALDEALLEEADAERPGETLRLWESPRMAVVVGRSSRLSDEVDVDACRRRSIPILRRPSGGAAVLIGPGCLMYSLVLSHQARPGLRAVDHAHRFVLTTLAEAMGSLGVEVFCRGTSDLAHGRPPRKVSGNSMRLGREHLLYHGTLLYGFPLEHIEACLRMPPREPDYRGARRHDAFLANLPLEAVALGDALARAWDAVGSDLAWPRDRTARLVEEKYSQSQWNERLW